MEQKFLVLRDDHVCGRFASKIEARSFLNEQMLNHDFPASWMIVESIDCWECRHRGPRAFYHERTIGAE